MNEFWSAVISVAFGMLGGLILGHHIWAVNPVIAQGTTPCGTYSNPCYVKILGEVKVVR